MMIYGDYGIDDILMDSPCHIADCGNFYTVSVSDYKKFQRYLKYIILSNKHLNIKDKNQLLNYIIWNNIAMMNNNIMPKDIEIQNQLHFLVINELESLFSIVTRKKVRFNETKFLGENPQYEFISEDKSVIINQDNFDTARLVILKQNMLHEPTIYESELVREWADKVKRARLKTNKPLEFYEVLTIVSANKKINYKDLNSYNIVQLYADYSRIIHDKCCESMVSVRSAILSQGGDISSLSNIDYTDSVINELFKNPDDSLFIDAEDSNINKAMSQGL